MALLHGHIKNFSDYPIKIFRYQKIIGPIDEHYNPPSGSEVFISRIPEDATEKELFPFLSAAGRIHKFRLMLQEENGSKNRGFAYVMFTTAEEATNAVKKLNSVLFETTYLSIEKSFDNCRLFVGGIPDRKTKDEVWLELVRCGFKNIVEVIMYRSYTDRALNRGFVFVEFQTHQQAAEARSKFKNLRLWGQKMVIDWSTPLPDVDSEVLTKVKILFLRNLRVNESKESFQSFLGRLLFKHHLEKVYKFKDYAFVHFQTREDASDGLEALKRHYRDSKVEVTWAIPQQFAPKKRHLSTKLASVIQQPQSAKVPSSSSESFSDDIFLDQHGLQGVLDDYEHIFASLRQMQQNTIGTPLCLLDMPLINIPSKIQPLLAPEYVQYEAPRRTFSGSSDDSGICLPNWNQTDTTFRNTAEELRMIPDEYRPGKWIPNMFHEGSYKRLPRENTESMYAASADILDDHQRRLVSAMINFLFDE